MASPVSLASQLTSALWTLKTMYDQHKDNKQEIKELEEFFEQYGREVPSLQQSLKTCKGTEVAATVLKQVETDIAEATKKLNDWCTEKKFFRVFNSAQRMEELKKLHRNVMASVQNNLQKATLSIVVLNLRENQAQGSSSSVKLLNSSTEVQSVLTTQIGSMDYNMAMEARDVALKASHALYADEKFWADVIAAIDKREVYISNHKSFMDPILHSLMIDPVVTSNGITYCRWTIIDNNMKNPHNPGEDLVIRADNASLRSELFEAFPEQMSKFRQRRSDYRRKALELVEEDQVADAAVFLQHVLEWDKNDEECTLALAKVSAMLENFYSESLQALHSDANDVAGPSSNNAIESKSLGIPSVVPRTGSLYSSDVDDKLSDKDDKLSDKDDKLSDKDDKLSDKDDKLSDKDGKLSDKDDKLSDEDDKLSNTNEIRRVTLPWHVESKLELKTRWFQGHSQDISHVNWSPKSKEIATASKDGTVVVWEIKVIPRKSSWYRISEIIRPPKLFYRFSWQITRDEVLKDTWLGRVKQTLKGHSGPVNCVAYSGDGRYIATASSDNTVRVWNAQTGKTIHTLDSHADHVTCVAWSSPCLLASASADSSTIVWNGKSGKQLFTLKGHTDEVTCVAWSPCGDRLATTSADHSTIVWLREGQKRLHTFNGHQAKVTSVAWNSDGKFLVSASVDNSIIMWDLEAGCGTQHEGFHLDWINSVAWCPHTNLIATASDDFTARVVATKSSAIRIQGGRLDHSQQVRCVSWGPEGRNEGRFFVTASGKSIKIYEVRRMDPFEFFLR